MVVKLHEKGSTKSRNEEMRNENLGSDSAEELQQIGFGRLPLACYGPCPASLHWGACLHAMDHAQHLCTGVLACMLWTMPSISALGCLLACYGPCPASLHWCLLACYGPCPAFLRWCLLASINCPTPRMHSELGVK